MKKVEFDFEARGLAGLLMVIGLVQIIRTHHWMNILWLVAGLATGYFFKNVKIGWRSKS